MILKGIIDTDTVNYKKVSMVLEFPHCNFKCDKECGLQVCQNSKLAFAPDIEIDNKDIIKRYMENPMTEAIVMQGLEPFDSLGSLYVFISDFRDISDDDIVIYTGYKEEEIFPYLDFFKKFGNIYIKFGRYRYDRPSRYDEVLGVTLASTNQYCKKIC
jgi:hypothetical protein